MSKAPYSEYLEKERNREQLNEAVESTPLGHVYRRYFLFLSVLAGAGAVYFSDTPQFQRFKEKLTSLRPPTTAQLVSSKLMPKQLQSTGPKAFPQLSENPDAAVAGQLAKETAPSVAASGPVGVAEDDMHAEMADQAQKLSLAEKMQALSQKMASGDAADILTEQRKVSAMAPSEAPKAQTREGPAGIDHGHDAPTLIFPEGSGLGDSAYRIVTRVPGAYAQEAQEFPDIQ